MFCDFQTKTPVSIILYACLYSNKLRDFCRQTHRKRENTVYVSIFTNMLLYLTVMQTLLLCVQTIFC